ncbi:hypothetical protein ACFYVL_00015 [Streptomyces sp. NPDC004111]|uniref:hypothetical protein n=1 Tax=Streptomyces sp. NPDC004111 TaxID=3364690 RepID=UPI00367BE11F
MFDTVGISPAVSRSASGGAVQVCKPKAATESTNWVLAVIEGNSRTGREATSRGSATCTSRPTLHSVAANTSQLRRL